MFLCSELKPHFDMEEIIFNLLSGLPTAAAVLYIWIVSERNHTSERKEWREELRDMANILSKVTDQVNNLSFIIENYVLTNRKNPAGKQD